MTLRKSQSSMTATGSAIIFDYMYTSLLDGTVTDGYAIASAVVKPRDK